MIKNWEIVEKEKSDYSAPSYTIFIEGSEMDAISLAGKLMDFNPACEEATKNSFNYAIVLSPKTDNVLEDIKKRVQEFVAPAVPEVAMPTPAIPQEEIPTVTDKDMLIKDMEGTVLDNMPLEDIFSAETKYDMFLDLKNNTLTKNSQDQRKNKMTDLADGKDSLEDSFDIFEQNIKEHTCIIDLDKLDFASKGDVANPVNNLQGDFTPEKITVNADSMKEELAAIIPEIPTPEAEISTLRDSVDSLAKTFNLEKTIDAKTLREQYEKTLLQGIKNAPVAPSKVDEPTPVSTPKPVPPAMPSIKPDLNLKPNTPKREPIMEENKPINNTQPLSQPQKPTAPKPPVAPVAPKPVGPSLPKQVPPTPAVVAPAPKKKDIDHSIELPLSEIKKHNWPLEIPLVPTYTLENMVMSVNRFAHATAVSVVGNPGKLYNPLVLYGVAGTGKTHFLNAMAYSFSQKYPQETIFLTNGVRLSRGIQRYVTEGNIEKFNSFMDTVNVLLIDDIHLLAINEQNKKQVSALLNKFLQDKKQIVITSKYPPESLERLENLIQFKLRSGWISELKHVKGAAYLKQAKKVLQENNVLMTDQQIAEFFDESHMTLGTLTRTIHRLKVLENLVFPHLETKDRSQIKLLEKLIPVSGEDTSSEILAKNIDDITSIPTVGNGEWGRIGFFYPQNYSQTMNWMVYATQQRAKELGIPGGCDIAVRSSYTTTNIISSAFKIANLCDNRKLKGAVILGPLTTECEPSIRENFYDILTHMLEVMLIRCGIINYEDIRKPSTYTKIITELMR